MPGTDPREAARIVMGECHALPFLPELADRGLGADQVGRTLAMLVDLPVDVSPRGWRLSGSRGRPARIAADLLDRDSDALEEADEQARDPEAEPSAGRLLQVRVLGPWSLAAGLELPAGLPVLTDRGARRDLAASLAEGVAMGANRLAGRLRAGTRIILDEPMLWRVCAGTVPAPSHFDPVAAVPADQLALALCRFADALRAAGVDEVFLRLPTGSGPDAPALFSDFAEPPTGETPFDGLCLTAGPLLAARSHDALDAAGAVLGDGRRLLLEGAGEGVRPPGTPAEAEQAAAALLALLDRLASPRYESLGRLVLTPTVEQVTGEASAATRALAGARLVADTAPRLAE
jgi:hypothetical protein